MTDQTKLCIAFVAIIVADLAFIAYGYHHGNMHLFKTLEAAVAAWQ